MTLSAVGLRCMFQRLLLSVPGTTSWVVLMDFLIPHISSLHTVLSYSCIFQRLAMLFPWEFCVGISLRFTLWLSESLWWPRYCSVNLPIWKMTVSRCFSSVSTSWESRLGYSVFMLFLNLAKINSKFLKVANIPQCDNRMVFWYIFMCFERIWWWFPSEIT